jgi:hypothetical protein
MSIFMHNVLFVLRTFFFLQTKKWVIGLLMCYADLIIRTSKHNIFPQNLAFANQAV